VTVHARRHTIVQDKPVASGGQDAGPMASELLLAGLLACQHSTFVKIAAKRKVDARIAALDGALEFTDGDISGVKVAFKLKVPASVNDEAIGTLLRLTDKACTISKVLKVPVEGTFTRA
jgi:uncharacterized OsmC-like protein